MHAAFLDDGCAGPILVERFAGEAEGFQGTALGDLLGKIPADHADAGESEGQIVCFQLAGEQAAFINVQLEQLEDVELGIEALLEEALDRGAESRLAFGGSRDAAVPEAR